MFRSLNNYQPEQESKTDYFDAKKELEELRRRIDENNDRAN
jgi:hypothetical protein